VALAERSTSERENAEPPGAEGKVAAPGDSISGGATSPLGGGLPKPDMSGLFSATYTP
jgi:hypothetical protein